MFLNVLADADAERLEAKIARVAGLALLQRTNRRLTDGPRRGLVRLADSQRDHISASDHQLKEVADAAARNAAELAGQLALQIHLARKTHGDTGSGPSVVG